MPCRYDTYESEADIRASWEKEFTHNSSLAEIFCATMLRIEQMDVGASDPIMNMLPEKAQRWWIEHKERDRRRVEGERREMERQQAIAAAYAKLTPEEQKLLGLGKKHRHGK